MSGFCDLSFSGQSRQHFIGVSKAVVEAFRPCIAECSCLICTHGCAYWGVLGADMYQCVLSISALVSKAQKFQRILEQTKVGHDWNQFYRPTGPNCGFLPVAFWPTKTRNKSERKNKKEKKERREIKEKRKKRKGLPPQRKQESVSTQVTTLWFVCSLSNRKKERNEERRFKRKDTKERNTLKTGNFTDCKIFPSVF